MSKRNVKYKPAPYQPESARGSKKPSGGTKVKGSAKSSSRPSGGKSSGAARAYNRPATTSLSNVRLIAAIIAFAAMGGVLALLLTGESTPDGATIAVMVALSFIAGIGLVTALRTKEVMAGVARLRRKS